MIPKEEKYLAGGLGGIYLIFLNLLQNTEIIKLTLNRLFDWSVLFHVYWKVISVNKSKNHFPELGIQFVKKVK